MKIKKMLSICFATILAVTLLVSASVSAALFTVASGTGDIIATGYTWDAGTKASVTAKFIAEYQSQQSRGFNIGTPAGGDKVHVWGSSLGDFLSQNHSGGDSTRNEWGMNNLAIIMMAAPDKPAFTVANDMVVNYAAIGAVGVVGAPLSNEFIVNGDTYQKFTEFFIKIPSGSTTGVAYHFDQATTDGLVIPLSAQGADMSKIGSPLTTEMITTGGFSWASGKVAIFDTITAAQAKAKFEAEYLAQTTAGFDLGIPELFDTVNNPTRIDGGAHNEMDGYVHMFGNGSDAWLAQNFYLGDSTSALWNITNCALVFLPLEAGAAFTLKNAMLTAFGENGISVLGAPTSNEFTVGGSLYQRFAYDSFVKITDGVAATLTEEEIGALGGLTIPAAALGVGYTGGDVVIESTIAPTPTVTTAPTTAPTTAATTAPTSTNSQGEPVNTSDAGMFTSILMMALAGGALAIRKIKK